jgi:hypothetical protein
MLVDADPHLLVERLAMEARGLLEGVADQRGGNAVIDDVIEADLGQGMAELPPGLLQCTGLSGQIRAEVDDRDGVRARHAEQ